MIKLEDYLGHEIVIRLGKTGAGKTLDQTLSLLNRILAGEETWSSYWLNLDLPNIHYFKADDWDTIKKIRNSIILFDEVADSFDNRAWEKEDSEIRKFFRYHRKRHNDIYCNTQDISLVAKTIGILAHKWYMIEKPEENLLETIIYNIFGGRKIKLDITEMSLQKLKKMANGMELGENDLERGDISRKYLSYSEKEIIREDLNDKKIEIVHWYCPKCRARQGEIIKKDDTENIAQYDKKKKIWLPKNEIFCPKHKEQKLELRKSGIYDTDYELEFTEEKIFFKAFIKKEKIIMEEFNGHLTEKQQQEMERRKAFYKQKISN